MRDGTHRIESIGGGIEDKVAVVGRQYLSTGKKQQIEKNFQHQAARGENDVDVQDVDDDDDDQDTIEDDMVELSQTHAAHKSPAAMHLS